METHLPHDVWAQLGLRSGSDARRLDKWIQTSLAEHGIVALQTSTASDLRGSGLDPARRAKWGELLIALKRHGRLDEVERPAGQVRIASAEELGDLTEDPMLVATEPAFERVSLDMVDESRVYETVRELRESGEIAPAERRLFWDAVIGPLALRSRAMTVSDRYLFAGSRRPGGLKHLDWLLGRVANQAGAPIDVTLFALQTPDERFAPLSPADTLTQITHLPGVRKGSRIRWLRVVLGDKESIDHARHIRFSCRSVVELPDGLDRITWRDGVFKWSFRPQVAAAEAREAKALSETTASVAAVNLLG